MSQSKLLTGDSRWLEVQGTVTNLREIESSSFQESGNFRVDFIVTRIIFVTARCVFKRILKS